MKHEKLIRLITKTRKVDDHFAILPPAQLENILIALANNNKELEERVRELERPWHERLIIRIRRLLD